MVNHREPVVFSWSGGKDSALALHAVLSDPGYDVVGLLTTVAGQFGRVSHHGVREELLCIQAASIGLPLEIVYLPMNAAAPCTNAEYEELMGTVMARYCAAGVRTVAHGDIFLEDLRAYRDRNLARAGMRGLYPLWKRDTAELVRQFVTDGFRAYLCCVDGKKLGEPFAGRPLDLELLRDLPAGVDPCGENGEYHSFVYAGPIFHKPVAIERGVVVCREGRFYADLLPAGSAASNQHPDMPPVALPDKPYNSASLDWRTPHVASR
jgi:uncharacterized protein (TIGR00290 family)